MDEPRYVVLVMLDEPQATPETYRLRDLGLERGADGRQDHRAHRAACSASSPMLTDEDRKKLAKQATAQKDRRTEPMSVTLSRLSGG